MSTGRCPHCPRTVLWVQTRRRRNMPLDPAPDRTGTWIPVAGHAYQAHELRAMGGQIADYADAPAHHNHVTTCPNWPRGDTEPARSTIHAPGLACHECGTVDHTVRHTAVGDRCSLHKPDVVHCATPDPTVV